MNSRAILKKEATEIKLFLRESSWKDFEVKLRKSTKRPVIEIFFNFNSCNFDSNRDEVNGPVRTISAVMRGFGYELEHRGDVYTGTVNHSIHRATYYKI